MVRLTVTNHGGFTSHQETTVNAKPSVEESDNTGLIVGLVISLIAVLVLAAAVAFLLYR